MSLLQLRVSLWSFTCWLKWLSVVFSQYIIRTTIQYYERTFFEPSKLLFLCTISCMNSLRLMLDHFSGLQMESHIGPQWPNMVWYWALDKVGSLIVSFDCGYAVVHILPNKYIFYELGKLELNIIETIYYGFKSSRRLSI